MRIAKEEYCGQKDSWYKWPKAGGKLDLDEENLRPSYLWNCERVIGWNEIESEGRVKVKAGCMDFIQSRRHQLKKYIYVCMARERYDLICILKDFNGCWVEKDRGGLGSHYESRELNQGNWEKWWLCQGAWRWVREWTCNMACSWSKQKSWWITQGSGKERELRLSGKFLVQWFEW